MNVLNKPVACQDGHMFCTQCFDTATRTSRGRCPYDRTFLGSSPKKTPVLPIKALIDNKAVKCPTALNSSTCPWKGTIALLDNHKSDCLMEIVPCPNDGCMATNYRGEQESHKRHCSFSLVACDKCTLSIRVSERDSHKAKCEKEDMPCPNNCGQIVKR